MLDRSRILELARSRRADLASVNLQAAAADQDVTVTRLDLVPTLALSGFTGREEATDDLLGFSVGLRLPLFRRQQAATGAAQAERARARSDLATAERLVQADVRAVADRYERTRIASLRFAGEVLQAALDNVRLTEVAFAEGEVDVTEVIVLRGTAVAAQLEYLEVLQDAYGAWFQLAAVAAAEPDELSQLLNGGGE
jgi:outer membrane protein TolC